MFGRPTVRLRFRRLTVGLRFGRLSKGLRRHRNKLLISLLVIAALLFILWAARAAGKTTWELIEILIIPAVLGVGALLFQMAERRADRYNTLERQRQDTLITYYDRMSDLLLTRKLRDASEGSEVRTVARARTVSALRSLDGQRIAQLLQFLTESNLGGKKLLTVNLSQVDLQGANLWGVNLQRALLRRVNLQGANLEEAKMQWTRLREANLQGARLRKANLQGADLERANLQRAYLFEANLQHALLVEANLQGAFLWEANLQRALLGKANLQRADLGKANLQEARLRKANLQGAFLWEADLQGADLKGANLAKVNLTRVNITIEQLSAVKSLQGATMPDGTKYEEWIARGKPDWSQGAGEQQGVDKPEENG